MVISARSRRVWAYGVIGCCALLSACTRAAGQPPSSTPATQSVAPPGPASASASTHPASPAAASLRVAANIDLGPSPGPGQTVAAEAPDGAVFYADGQVVMVVDGDSAPAAAEHPGAKVLGLGASAATLYVVTPKDLLAYSRSTGNQTGRWALTGSPATPTTAGVAVGGNGDVWVWTDWATDFSGYEYAMLYAVVPGAAKPSVLSKAAQPGSLVTDGSDAFFLAAGSNSEGANLTEASPGPGASAAMNVRTVSAAPTQALVGFSGSQVVLYAQPDSLYTYTPGSPAAISTRTNVVQPVTVAGTSSGLLFLTCSRQACSTVAKVDQSSGQTRMSVAVPVNSDILLGPSPALLGVEAGDLHLVRLS